MTEKIKNIFWIIFAVALVALIAGWSFFNPGPEHIEDTNGPENYTLQQITEDDVVSLKMGSRGGLAETESHLYIGPLDISDGVKYSCDKFTGVHRLYTATIFKGSDIHIYLSNFKIKSGNFAFYVVIDGKIVGEVKPNVVGSAEFLLENIEKTADVEYIIAGESADFEFVAPLNW